MEESTKKKGLITTDDYNNLESKLVEPSQKKVLPVKLDHPPKDDLPSEKFTPVRTTKKENLNNPKRRKKENNPLYCMDTNIDQAYLKNAEMKTANLLGPLLKIAKAFALEKDTTMIDVCNVALYKYLLSEKAIKK